MPSCFRSVHNKEGFSNSGYQKFPPVGSLTFYFKAFQNILRINFSGLRPISDRYNKEEIFQRDDFSRNSVLFFNYLMFIGKHRDRWRDGDRLFYYPDGTHFLFGPSGFFKCIAGSHSLSEPHFWSDPNSISNIRTLVNILPIKISWLENYNSITNI